MEREALDLVFFSLTTSEDTATTADERQRTEEEEMEEGAGWESLWVDPRKEEEVVLRGSAKRGFLSTDLEWSGKGCMNLVAEKAEAAIVGRLCFLRQ